MKTNKIEKKDFFSLSLIAVSMFFFVNPLFNIVDIIPDFIGYLLLVLGLDRLADMEGHFSSAKRGFTVLLIAGILKTLCCLLLPIIGSTFIIVFSSVFAIIEGVFFIPSVINLMGGFQYYGLRHEANSCFNVYKTNKKSKEKIKAEGASSVTSFAICAFIIRLLSTVIPEIPTLFSYNQTSFVSESTAVDWTYYIPLFYVLMGIAVLAASIPQAIQFYRYITEIKNDEKLISTLKSTYESEIAGDTCLFAEKKFITVRAFLILASLFCFSIYIDYVNWLPGGIAGIFFAISAYMMRKNSKASIATVVFGFLWIIPSVFEIVLQYNYHKLNYTPASFYNGIGQSVMLYPQIAISEIIGSVFMIITAWLFYACLSKLIAEHCVLYEKALPETREGKGPALCKRIMKAYQIVFWLITLMALSTAAHGVLCPLFPEIWMLNFILGAVMLAFLFRAENIARDELYDKLKGRI